MRSIQITQVLNGFIVQVGCQTVVFDSKSRLLGELGRYLENPTGVEEEYLKAGGVDLGPTTRASQECRNAVETYPTAGRLDPIERGPVGLGCDPRVPPPLPYQP